MLERQAAHLLRKKPIPGLLDASGFNSPGSSSGVTDRFGIQESFDIDFFDKGAGEVNIVPRIPSGAAAPSPTFTRATTATTILANGLIGSVASGVPRSYYDPSTLSYLGYLAEGARTNLGLSSEDLRAAADGNPVTEWVTADTTVTVAGTTAPDGSVNGNLITEGSAGTAIVQQAATMTADVNYATTRWFKAGNHEWIMFQIGNGVNVARAWFNLITGVVGITSGAGTALFVNASVIAFVNGWYRCELVASVGSGATGIAFQTSSAVANGNSTRIAGATRYEWGAQIENNVSFASSYIPTTTAAVARNADVLTYPTTGWLNAASGTIVYEANGFAGAAGTFPKISSLNDGTSNERMSLFAVVDTGTFGAFVADGGVAQMNTATANSTTSTANAKGAFAYELNNSAITLDGGAVVTDTSCTIPTVTQFQIANFGGAEQLSAPIRRVAYFPVRAPNGTLQAMTS